MIARLILALAAGALVAAVVLPALIRLQQRRHAGQQIYEDAPKSHARKQGTPTLGGIAFALAALVGFAILPDGMSQLPLLLLTVGAAAIGLIDDWLIVRGRRALGLRARWKFFWLGLLAVVYVFVIGNTTNDGTRELWFGGSVTLPYLWWFVLSVLAVVGAANAVNLTDGLDGLAAGTVIPTLFILQLPLARGAAYASGIAAAVLGACAVFLGFNRHPARIFMGDTGSLALGALLAGLAIQAHALLLLPFFGAIFVFEALSVMLQVASFKTLHRRIFRMSPLHHHFELSGWRETAVTTTFVAAQTVFALATWFASWGVRRDV